MSKSHIKIENLTFGYSKGNPILDQLTMEVPKGAIYGFLGKNGAGKTTTIRNMLGLLKPSSGTIQMMDKSITKQAPSVLNKVGSLIENPSIYEHLTGIENLKLSCNYFSISKKKIEPILTKVGLSSAGKTKAKKYSTGMKQRLGLAMALVHDPEILILDEPIRGLDPTGIQEIRKLILEINSEGTTVLLSSHILTEIEKLVSHVGILEKGSLQFEGTLGELMKHINNSSTIRIRTNNPLALHALLKDRHTISIESTWATLPFLQDAAIAALVKELSKSGIDIYEIRKDNNALESIFLGITAQN